MNGRALTLVCIVFAAFASTAAAESPTGWRSDASGRYPKADPPTKWSPTENVVWKTELPGRSFGSPVVVGDRIFVVSDPAELLCVRATDGEILWQRTNSAVELYGPERAKELLDQWDQINRRKNELRREYNDLRKAKPEAKEEHKQLQEKIKAVEEQINAAKLKQPVPAKGGAGNTAGTPVCDGRYVYAGFGSGIVAAYDLQGSRRWIEFVEGSTIGFGHSSSPLLVDGKLIVHFHDLVALSADDGQVVWRTELPARHATAVSVQVGGVRAIVSPAGNLVQASDGKVLISERALSVSEGSPIVHEGVLYAQSGKTSAFRMKASDENSIELELLWEATASRGRRTPSPVFQDGLVYGVTTNGILDVTDANTGQVHYRKRVELGNNIYSSVTAAGDFIFVSGTKGETLVLKSGPEYQEVARNQLESIGSNPVFVAKRMYVRTQKHLYCIGE